MAKHKAEDGDCLLSIAKKHRFFDWKAIYDHGDNAELKKKRPNPNLLVKDDEWALPEETKKEDGAVDKTHTFSLKEVKATLRLVLKDDAGKALNAKDYKLVIGAFTKEDKTGADGKIEVEIPADAREGDLTVWPEGKGAGKGEGLLIPLLIGSLEPVSEPAASGPAKTLLHGVRARLNNLGFDPGPIDASDMTQTTKAVKEFQVKHNIAPKDGTINKDTLDKLVSEHGC